MVKLRNRLSSEITVVEVIKETRLAPGEELEVDAATTIIRIE